jgi:hypothetical protein
MNRQSTKFRDRDGQGILSGQYPESYIWETACGVGPEIETNNNTRKSTQSNPIFLASVRFPLNAAF